MRRGGVQSAAEEEEAVNLRVLLELVGGKLRERQRVRDQPGKKGKEGKESALEVNRGRQRRVATWGRFI